MNLVIVESPTKAKTIQKFLGKEFVIESSYGHVRDLPKGKLGVDVEHDFEPTYVTPRKAQKHVTALKKLAAKADTIVLATDEDREGEAIAWHLYMGLKLDTLSAKIQRIVFHEITKKAIEDAIKNPRSINEDLVNAQQMRRVLDRLVGYELSPFLWKKVAKGLSAGRVQSVALRLIVEREKEIRAFKPDEYWTINTILSRLSDPSLEIEAVLTAKDGKAYEKLSISSEEQAHAITDDLSRGTYVVAATDAKETKKHPLPPFITSTLQQAASNRLGYSAKKTMRVAQQLYEKGFITYMRTDSVNLSEESLVNARAWITSSLGEAYAEAAPRRFKSTSRLAQEAHEAIRPTNPSFAPKSVSGAPNKFEPDEEKVYDLIWRRFIASQLPSARFSSVKAVIENGPYTLQANGSTLIFDGFLRIWPSKFEERTLPQLDKGEQLSEKELRPVQHFTEPPARYNEASLIKALEAHGIGRPSTYASIISVIQERNYVVKEEKRFTPTEIGEMVNTVLTEHFPEIVDIDFTAKLEDDLDRVAEGKGAWRDAVRGFYEPFHTKLEKKYESVKKVSEVETTNEVCEQCGRPMVIKFSRFGKFLACSGFPECRNAKSLNGEKKGPAAAQPVGKCPECGEGDVVPRRTKTGRTFYGCNRYPDCKYATWDHPNKPKKAKKKEKTDEEKDGA